MPNDLAGHPTTYYGVHKQTCEALARIFWEEEHVPSIGIRPCVVYGPGRDMTPYGMQVTDNIAPELIEALEASSDYRARGKAVAAFNAGVAPGDDHEPARVACPACGRVCPTRPRVSRRSLAGQRR